MIASSRKVRLPFLAPWVIALALLVAGCETGPGIDASGTDALQPATPPGAQGGQTGGPTQLLGEQGAQAGGDDAEQQVRTRAALLLPLTGRFADLGNAMLNAAQLAVFEMADRNFELMVFDTQSEADQASEAARKAVERGAGVIIGPLLSTSTRAAAQWAQVAGVPILSFSSDRTVAGNGVFVLGFTPSDQVERVVQYAKGRGVDRFALIAPDDPYGSLVALSLREAVGTVGGRVDMIKLTDAQEADFAQTVETVSASMGSAAASASASSPGLGPALMIAEAGGRLREVAAVLPAHGFQAGQPQLLGTGTWDEPWIGNLRALVGGWFAAPPPGARNRFVREYSQAYGATPPRLAGLAYDATALAAVLGRGGGGARLTSDVLTAPSGFVGTEGIFRLRSTGVAERGLAVLEVKPWGVDVVSDAPQSFAGI